MQDHPHVLGDRKIPLVASHGTASWVEEEGTIPESDDAFGQITIGAHKIASMIKVSDELLQGQRVRY